MKRFLLGILMAVSLLLIPTTVTHANTINLKAINTNVHRYYRTNRAVKIKVGLVNKTKHYLSRTLVLPPNTIISSNSGTTDSKGRMNQMDINIRYLSYAVVKPILKNGYYLANQDPEGNFSTKQFTRIKRPAYRLAYSDGDLYAGKVPTANSNFYETNQILITTDGYLEFYRYHPTSSLANPTSGFLNQPTSAAKITATKVKGNSRYLYTRTKVSGTNATHIKKSGNYRYRLRITNLHKPQTRKSENGAGYWSYYSIAGKLFYTLIGNDDD